MVIQVIVVQGLVDCAPLGVSFRLFLLSSFPSFLPNLVQMFPYLLTSFPLLFFVFLLLSPSLPPWLTPSLLMFLLPSRSPSCLFSLIPFLSPSFPPSLSPSYQRSLIPSFSFSCPHFLLSFFPSSSLHFLLPPLFLPFLIIELWTITNNCHSPAIPSCFFNYSLLLLFSLCTVITLSCFFN